MMAYRKRRLTDAQRAHAEAALAIVPQAIRAFAARHPSYRRVLSGCDMQSVAEMAVVEASFCYNPAKSKPTTYYGSAIRNALLKEVRRYQRSREGANERVPMEKALGIKFLHDMRQRAVASLRLLPPEDRALIEAHVIEGRSLRAIGREQDRDWRTIKARLLRAYDRMRHVVSDCTETLAGNPDPEQEGPA